jgi:hypothetical protein
MKRKTLTVFLISALLVSGAASAFVLLEPPRTWDTPPTYIVDDRGMASVTDGDGGVSATVTAIRSNQAWNGAGSGTVINAQAGSVGAFQVGDGIPMLNFDDPLHVCNGNCLAATLTGFYEDRADSSVRIFDADIVTNTRFNFTSENEPDGCSSEIFVEGVMVHEAGHGLGLGHTDVAGATMYPSVSACNNSPATIEQDDASGLNALYSGEGPDAGGGGSCALLQTGESCSANGECCSGKCRGKPGNQTCR